MREIFSVTLPLLLYYCPGGLIAIFTFTAMIIINKLVIRKDVYQLERGFLESNNAISQSYEFLWRKRSSYHAFSLR